MFIRTWKDFFIFWKISAESERAGRELHQIKKIYIYKLWGLLTDHDTRMVVEDDAVTTTLLGEAVGAADTESINKMTFKIKENSQKDLLNTMADFVLASAVPLLQIE